jgi:glutamine amidotransferase
MIVVINYGTGNLRSVYNALYRVGADVVISHNPEDLACAEKVVLPGVGAFGAAMANLRDQGWTEAILREVVQNRKPFLGICLGLQVLADIGFERGVHTGLGILKGRVERIQSPDVRLPHVGWNDIRVLKPHPLFANLNTRPTFYFVHSFKMVCEFPGAVAATCTYGEEFTAAVASENMFATQFHPEKSQDQGLKLLENFVEWNGRET